MSLVDKYPGLVLYIPEKPRKYTNTKALRKPTLSKKQASDFSRFYHRMFNHGIQKEAFIERFGEVYTIEEYYKDHQTECEEWLESLIPVRTKKPKQTPAFKKFHWQMVNRGIYKKDFVKRFGYKDTVYGYWQAHKNECLKWLDEINGGTK